MFLYLLIIICGVTLVRLLIVPEWIKSAHQSMNQKSLWAWLDPVTNLKSFLLNIIERIKPKPADFIAIEDYLEKTTREENVTTTNLTLISNDNPIFNQQIKQLEQEIKNKDLIIHELEIQLRQLDKLVIEKNKTLSRVHSELISERLHRQEFEKVRNLLDEQIIKERQQNRDFKLKIDHLYKESNVYTNRLTNYEDPTD